MLSTFDQSFDFTFRLTSEQVKPPLPPVGGDGSTPGAGGAVPGAVLPFAKTMSLLPAGRPLAAQAWDNVGTLPMAVTGMLPQFVVAVPRPDDISQTPWCQNKGTILRASDLQSVDTFTTDIVRMVSADTLFMIQPKGTFVLDTIPILVPGRYQVLLGDRNSDYRISDVFEVVSDPCKVYRIRLSNPTPIGRLPYGTDNFEQTFYVSGELLGPRYDETETKSGSEKTAGTVTKSWVLSLDNVTESIIDALSLVGLHRLVEVDIMNPDGTIARAIQAMAYTAKAAINQNDDLSFRVDLTLPVEVTSWSKQVAGCAPGDELGTLLPINCLVEGPATTEA